jgi:hypothetical protein
MKITVKWAVYICSSSETGWVSVVDTQYFDTEEEALSASSLKEEALAFSSDFLRVDCFVGKPEMVLVDSDSIIWKKSLEVYGS